jgi:hypothetical protein
LTRAEERFYDFLMQQTAARVAFGILLLVAPATAADIYVWRDQYGVSHYTTDLANVPPEFRSTAITVAKDWVRAAPPPEPAPVEQPTPKAEPSSSAVLTDEWRESLDVDYDAGYAAGMHDAGTTVITASSVAPVVQLMSFEPPRERLLPVFAPVFVQRQRHPHVVTDDEKRDRDEHRPFASAAGPPLLGAAGPSPYFPFGR